MQKKEQTNEEEKRDARIYEVGFHLVPTIAEENIPVEVTAIRDAIEAAAGHVIADDHPKHIDLAYSMVKIASNKRALYHSAYFGWLKFEIDPAGARALEVALKKNDNILRFIFVKTVRENTMVPKKVLMQKRTEDGAPREVAKVEEKPALTEEELDKTIEDLVIS